MTCGACKFFLPDGDADLGWCRRFPPVVVMLKAGAKPDAGWLSGQRFPQMHGSSGWCGEFQAKVH